jgi:hypothetical protein
MKSTDKLKVEDSESCALLEYCSKLVTGGLTNSPSKQDAPPGFGLVLITYVGHFLHTLS